MVMCRTPFINGGILVLVSINCVDKVHCSSFGPHPWQVHYLKNPADTETTSKMLPYFMTAERNMMHALAREGENAHLQALRTVPKNLQLMYL